MQQSGTEPITWVAEPHKGERDKAVPGNVELYTACAVCVLKYEGIKGYKWLRCVGVLSNSSVYFPECLGTLILEFGERGGGRERCACRYVVIRCVCVCVCVYVGSKGEDR